MKVKTWRNETVKTQAATSEATQVKTPIPGRGWGLLLIPAPPQPRVVIIESHGGRQHPVLGGAGACYS